jgi:hypothetical protein
MQYNKNEIRQPEGCVPETAALLQSLINSPIMDENYYLTTSNLCQAILTIADDIGLLVGEVIASLEHKRAVNVQCVEWTKERIWQIRSIAEVVDGRVSHEDFEKMMEVVSRSCAHE